MIDLIIVANGKSSRFGKNKLLEKINSQTVIEKTIECFLENKNFNKIIIVTNNEIENILKSKFFNIKFLKGGKTRSLSVKKGLQLVDSEFVMVHDGARPFVNNKLIENLISSIKQNDAVVPVLKITSCLKRTIGELITQNRDEFVVSQTPQLFKASALKKEYKNVDQDWYDDCQAIENKGYKIITIDGDNENIKITYKSDIKR
ncbi:2-C-methyl-D-erythritol 4-phosphate cytidylyltransferase [Spiroplasma gladiatoris]|uniref:2-C-methyl-D-erythritol 4-phosphate cytidylyltransferase n=1 Tax=Spiroplasma gladiatoris TaxID=2143 RepID=A0A4P7AGL1_9MOLU|nr:IspD/TarI family cytidylyltransferase [Spiroplasma gladiatoris]QBQ07221.1 2-C-methyl-D-erythritol 4-phosphate cytidylyltransferase [Spiroplasma gladiatoris]